MRMFEKRTVAGVVGCVVVALASSLLGPAAHADGTTDPTPPSMVETPAVDPTPTDTATDPVVVQVTLDPQGGVYTGELVLSWTAGGLASGLGTPTLDGSVFLGWFTDPVDGVKVVDGDLWTGVSDATLFARWAKAVTLTLDPQGGTLAGEAALVVGVGQPVAGLPAVTKPGATFAGWFTDPTGGTQVRDGDVWTGTDDVSLFARWTAKPAVRVTLSLQGGTYAYTKTLWFTPELTVAGLGTPWRPRMNFLGWYTAPSGGVKIVNGAVWTRTTATVLYAHWSKATAVKVSFNATGGWRSFGSKWAPYDKRIGTLPTAGRKGYFFAGWYTAQWGGTKISTSTRMRTQSVAITYYAHWQLAREFRFDANSGSVGTAYKDVKPGAKLGALPTPYKAGFLFMGWFTGKQRGGWNANANTRAQATGGVTVLYARWAPYTMYQSDARWRSYHYGISTFVNNGCCPSTVANAVRAVTGNWNVTPLVAMNWAKAHGYETTAVGRTLPNFVIDWPATYGVTVTRIPGGSSAEADAAARAAVLEGNWVIAYMMPGNWAVAGHYILWYNIEGDRAMVRDPLHNVPARTQNSMWLLMAQSWTYYIVTVPDSKKVWSV